MIDWSFEQIACDAVDITLEDLYGDKGDGARATRGSAAAAIARYLCFEYLHTTTAMTLGKIGARYGGRNHATITHGLRKYREFLESNDRMFMKALSYFNERVCRKDPIYYKKELTNFERDTIGFMIKKGIKSKDVAEFYGISVEKVHRIRQRKGIAETITELKETKKQNIKYYYNRGKLTQLELAELYNVGVSTIKNILKEK